MLGGGGGGGYGTHTLALKTPPNDEMGFEINRHIEMGVTDPYKGNRQGRPVEPPIHIDHHQKVKIWTCLQVDLHSTSGTLSLAYSGC